MSQNSFQIVALCSVVSAVVLAAGCSEKKVSVAQQQPELTKPVAVLPAPQQMPLTAAELSAESVESMLVDTTQTTKRALAKYALGAVPRMDHDVYNGPTSNTENYAEIKSNGVIQVAVQPVSTFSVDVDTGSYSNMRRFLNTGMLPPADAIRIEELVNYFSYRYENASGDVPFSINTEIGRTPWNQNTYLLHIGLKGYTVDPEDIPASNLVFLLDVSGSMHSPRKLDLLKSSIKMMSRQLSARDRVSMVVYAGASGVVLEPTAGNNTVAIDAALDQLRAGGSTNGQAGIQRAYAMAKKGFIKEGVNRIILATDGDFNVGLSDVDALKKLIERERKSGVALTTLGFGMGNYNDHLMEQLADVGDGSYAYIDTLNEARKVLSEELTATLLTIARDVKIQVEFNPAVVSEYRLLGYENRHLANEDFNNDKVDAGEIGAGHTVTAIYELALQGEGGERHTPLRYGNKKVAIASDDPEHVNEIASVRLRYKLPGRDSSLMIDKVIAKSDIIDMLVESSENFQFSAAVAAFGQWLRDSTYLNGFDLSQLVDLAAASRGDDTFGYRAEFTQLVRLADSLGEPAQAGLRKTSESEG